MNARYLREYANLQPKHAGAEAKATVELVSRDTHNQTKNV